MAMGRASTYAAGRGVHHRGSIMQTFASTRSLQRAVILLLSGMLLFGCHYIGQKETWHIVVPNNYTGFVMIEYRCPNGVDVARQMPHVQMNIKSNGTFCASSEPLVFDGVISAAYQNGTVIPEGPSVQKGLVFIFSDRVTYQQKIPRTFDIIWIGDYTYYQSYSRSIQYSIDREKMILDAFGVETIH